MNSREALRGDLELVLQRLCGLAGAEGLSALADADLTWSQVRVTMLLACSEQLPIRSVSERLGISVHSAGRTIDQLVELGIVDRRESRTDRRVKLVSLTPRGVEIIDQHLALRRRALQVFLDRLPDDRVAALAEALRPILAGDYRRPVSAEGRPSGPPEEPSGPPEERSESPEEPSESPENHPSGPPEDRTSGPPEDRTSGPPEDRTSGPPEDRTSGPRTAHHPTAEVAAR